MKCPWLHLKGARAVFPKQIVVPFRQEAISFMEHPPFFCSSPLSHHFQAVAPVSVAALILTIPTWCTRTSVTGECVLWAAAPRTAVAATTIAEIAVEEAAGTETAPPHLPLLTEIAVAGTQDAAMAPAPTHMTSTRTTAAAVASTAAPGVPLAQGVVEWGRPHLHQVPSLWWPSSLTLPSLWWAWWGTRRSNLLLHHHLLPLAESNVICAQQSHPAQHTLLQFTQMVSKSVWTFSRDLVLGSDHYNIYIPVISLFGFCGIGDVTTHLWNVL